MIQKANGKKSSHCAFATIQMHWCDAETLINHHYLKVKVSHGWLAIFNSCVNLEPTLTIATLPPPTTANKTHHRLIYYTECSWTYLFSSFWQKNKIERRKSSVQKSNWNPCDWLSAKNEWFVQDEKEEKRKKNWDVEL